MREQTCRRPSGESSQGLFVSRNHQMNSYPVLSDSYLERLLGTPTINGRTSRPEGSILFAEGEEALGAYVIWEGRVKISIGSDTGKSLILAFAGRGAVLGLPGTILGVPYAATAEVVEPVKFTFLSRDDLLRRLRATEAAAYAAAEIVSAVCYSVLAEFKAMHLSQSAEQRVARFLLGLLPTPKNSNGHMQVALNVSQEEIGQMIGVCRETVARVISRLKKRRIIELGTAALVIHDKAALEKLAESGGGRDAI